MKRIVIQTTAVIAMAVAASFTAAERATETEPGEADQESGKLSEIYQQELELIVVPPDQLPEDCRLSPMNRGPKFLLGNPTATQDPRVIGILSIGIFQVGGPNIAHTIECGFSAVYLDADSKETGVNLLLFKEAAKAKSIYGRLAPGGPFQYIHRGRHLMIVWSDNRNMELANWMMTHFREKHFPAR
jgi:hypothetical protein